MTPCEPKQLEISRGVTFLSFSSLEMGCGRSLSQSRNKGNEGVLGNLRKERWCRYIVTVQDNKTHEHLTAQPYCAIAKLLWTKINRAVLIMNNTLMLYEGCMSKLGPNCIIMGYNLTFLLLAYIFIFHRS